MTDDCVGPTLQECPVCGAVGLPERIHVHDCPAFGTRRRVTAGTTTPTEEVADDD